MVSIAATPTTVQRELGGRVSAALGQHLGEDGRLPRPTLVGLGKTA